jgi:proteic killer suppression protein
MACLKPPRTAHNASYVNFAALRTPGEGDRSEFIGKLAARQICPQSLWKTATRKLDQLDSLSTLDELSVPPGNRLEALSGNRRGQHCIRVNDQYRVCFVWTDNCPDQVEIVDYH